MKGWARTRSRKAWTVRASSGLKMEEPSRATSGSRMSRIQIMFWRMSESGRREGTGGRMGGVGRGEGKAEGIVSDGILL